MLVDCHAHLADPSFDVDRDAVRRRALAGGVAVVLVVGEDRSDDERVHSIVAEPCAGGATLLPCFGLHPDRYAEERPAPTTEEIASVEALARAHRDEIAAIGEVGLDRFLVESEQRRAAQEGLLERMVALALELDLPLNVHSRSAGERTLDLLRRTGARRVLMHAFDGRAALAVRAADEGFVFSIPPSVVRSEQKQKLVRRLPLEALALESDSPVLGPTREGRNEPSNVAIAAEFVASTHGVPVDRVAEVTTSNARRLFVRLDRVLAART